MIVEQRDYHVFIGKLPELLKAYEEEGIAIQQEHLGGFVPFSVELTDGRRLDAGSVVWTAGVRGSGLGALLGVPTDRQGRVPVSPTLQLERHPEVLEMGLAVVSGVDAGDLDRPCVHGPATYRGRARRSRPVVAAMMAPWSCVAGG